MAISEKQQNFIALFGEILQHPIAFQIFDSNKMGSGKVVFRIENPQFALTANDEIQLIIENSSNYYLISQQGIEFRNDEKNIIKPLYSFVHFLYHLHANAFQKYVNERIEEMFPKPHTGRTGLDVFEEANGTYDDLNHGFFNYLSRNYELKNDFRKLEIDLPYIIWA